MLKLLHLIRSNLLGVGRKTHSAEAIAERSLERAWQLVGSRVIDLPVAEARGYVRARAAGVLREAIVAHYGIDCLPHLYAPAMAATVDGVLQRAATTRTILAPRRAA